MGVAAATDIRLSLDGGEVSLRVACGGPPIVPECGPFAEVMQYFGVSANAGLLSGARWPPEQSRLECHESSADTRIEWSCVARALDPGAFRILLNLLCRQSSGYGRGLAVRIESVSSNAPLMSLHDVQSIPFPGTSFSERFVVSSRSLEDTGLRPVIRLEFGSPPDDSALERLFDRIRTWEWVVTHHGFRDRFDREPSVEGISASELYMVSDVVLEYCLYGFEAHRDSLASLINLVLRAVKDGMPVIEFQIESD